jgi:hypothetical protein
MKSIKNLFLPKLQPIYCFSQKDKYLGCFNLIYEYFYINKLSFFNLAYFDVFYKRSFMYLRLLNLNYKRYLKFNYWFYQYKWVITELNMNHLKSRIKSHTKFYNLRGYKMHLRGRFRRKQRASSYWFSRGKVPLNTITAFIDFAFFTIPLANSAITVKVWLYKSDDILHNYFLKIY